MNCDTTFNNLLHSSLTAVASHMSSEVCLSEIFYKILDKLSNSAVSSEIRSKVSQIVVVILKFLPSEFSQKLTTLVLSEVLNPEACATIQKSMLKVLRVIIENYTPNECSFEFLKIFEFLINCKETLKIGADKIR